MYGLCECIVNVWMYFWVYVATPTWIGHNRTVLVIEVLGIVNWLGRPAPLFGGILKVKTFVDAKRAGTDGKKNHWSSSKDLCLRSECYQISGILPIILNARNRKTPGISCLIGSASKHVAPQFWFKTQLPLSAPEEKGKQQIHLPYPILLLLYMFGLGIILQSHQSRKTRFKIIPD